MNVGSADLFDMLLATRIGSSDLLDFITVIADNGSFNNNGQTNG